MNLADCGYPRLCLLRPNPVFLIILVKTYSVCAVVLSSVPSIVIHACIQAMAGNRPCASAYVGLYPGSSLVDNCC